MNCPKNDALNFSKKHYCIRDITKKKDGPPNFKKLKVIKDNFIYHPARYEEVMDNN